MQASFRNLLGDGADLPFAAVAPVLAADSANTPVRSSQAAAIDPRIVAVEDILQGRPLAPHAASMVAAADQHGIDWRLLPVISVLESQGGLTACGGNAWGYARCQVHFPSFEEGIPIVAATLSSYGPYDSATLLCIWVSGDGCHTRHAIEYTHRAASLYPALGGTLAVRPIPIDDSPPPLPPIEPDLLGAAAPADRPPPSQAATPTSTPESAPKEPPTPPTSPSPAAVGEGAGG